MDGQQYLNQISQTTRPVKKSGGLQGILSSKFFLIGVIGLVLLIIIIIIGSVLGANKTDEKSLNYELLLHINNTAEVVQTYQPYVKSSELRSNGASLQGVLANTGKQLEEYLVERYDYQEKSVGETIANQAALNKDELESELFEAKINGILDRIFAHKMAYEITMLMTEESRIYDMTSNEALKNLLDESYNSLTNLYDNFNNFSETK